MEYLGCSEKQEDRGGKNALRITAMEDDVLGIDMMITDLFAALL